MKAKRDALKVVHNVRLYPMGNYIYIGWDGFNNRHDYMMVRDFRDLDILLTEITQAVQNYKHKHIVLNNKYRV